MHDLILHHYPNSPFSEKIRLVLGFKGLHWKSVLIPAISPKPDLVALTGGYRRTPVLQIGADIYCDSALICEVLEQRAPQPTLYPPQQQGWVRTLAQWADSTLFSAAMAYNLQPAGLAQLFAKAPPEMLQAFSADRGAMATGMPRLRPADAAAAYATYVQRLSDMLSGQDFVLGAAPCLADFSMLHPLWFTRMHTPVLADVLQTRAGVLAWMDRMVALGHGHAERLSASQAIALAAASEPAALSPNSVSDAWPNEHRLALGSRVQIYAESFGQEPTEGELVAATHTTYTLRRADPRAGVVHVHFPRIGYVLRAAQA